MMPTDWPLLLKMVEVRSERQLDALIEAEGDFREAKH